MQNQVCKNAVYRSPDPHKYLFVFPPSYPQVEVISSMGILPSMRDIHFPHRLQHTSRYCIRSFLCDVATMRVAAFSAPSSCRPTFEGKQRMCPCTTRGVPNFAEDLRRLCVASSFLPASLLLSPLLSAGWIFLRHRRRRPLRPRPRQHFSSLPAPALSAPAQEPVALPSLSDMLR